MPTEAVILAALSDAVAKLAQEVKDLCKMISGDPFDPNDTGMKGNLIGAMVELEQFNAADHKANTAFREKKEDEMSRMWVGIIILVANVIVTSLVVALITNLSKTGG